MDIDKTSLLAAAAKAGITGSQAEKLWTELDQQHLITSSDKKFGLANVMYYLGAMIVILAMGWLIGVGWEHFGGLGIFGIAVLYAALFAFIGDYLWDKKQLRIPGGLFMTMAVCMTPLAVYGFQRFTGWWIVDEPGQYQDYYTWVKGGWFMMEVGTIIAGLIALKFYRFPFLTAPIFFSLWYMSMDIVPLIYGQTEFLWNERLWVSLWFGLALLVIAYIIDRRTVEDYAFWGYFFGMLAFWFGLSLLESHNEFQRFIYCLINVGLIFLSVLLQRTIFLIFGALGVFVYISTLFYKYFSDSELFPFLLSLVGVMVIFVGVLYQKHQHKIEAWVLNSLPDSIKDMLPASRNKPL
jgi:hypothetical protein